MKRFLVVLALLALIVSPVYAGRFCQVHTLYASALIDSGTTYSTALDAGEYYEGIILINLTAETGTATFDVTLQFSTDNSTWFDQSDSFTQMTAVGKQTKKITNFGKYIRLKMVVGGSSSPDFTGTVTFIGKD